MTSLSLPGADIWICRRTRPAAGRPAAGELVHAWRAIDSAILTQCGRRDLAAGTIRSQGQAGYLSYGPYLKLEAGTYEIVWEGTSEGDASAAVAEVACGKGQEMLREIRIGRGTGVLAKTRFHLNEAVEDIEFRIRISADDVIVLTSMELRRSG